ncbi:MAG: alpha-amylase [Prevotellaceae bacterium]|jgi:glycosidase|nr:alpha-amylase [Prevotellaceae bacterium]
MKIFPLLLLAALFASCSKNSRIPDEYIPPPVDPAIRDGITRIGEDTLAFVLFAPGKKSVYLVGEFNDWKTLPQYQLRGDGDRFRIKLGGLDRNRSYVCQYLIDDKERVADPYASSVVERNANNNDPAMVVTLKPDGYQWKTNRFSAGNPERLVVYEILIRDFSAKRNIKGVQERLPYLKSLGVTAVELMPFNEFEGDDGWGYNPSFYFAPERSYGTSSEFKEFIDECHAAGIAVIMDLVLNHSYGQSPMVRMYRQADGTVAPDNPWYNVKSNFANPDAQWGYDFNHESPYTRAFVDSVCAYWMKEYRIDGFRFDFTKGFSNTPHPASGSDDWGSLYDAARIANLKRICDGVKKRNPDAIVIAEHLAENREEKELADYGLFLWGNLNYNVNEATMGWIDGDKSDFSSASYRQRGWNSPRLISYMESHDEERIMFKNKTWGNDSRKPDYNVQTLATALRRTEAAAVVFFSVPGPKMIWQFGEMGYDVSIDYGGRLGKKPILWEYLDEPERKALRDVFAAMTDLHVNDPLFSTASFAADLKSGFKSVVLTDGNRAAAAIANFDVNARTGKVAFGKTGKWTEYFSGAEITVGAPNEEVTLEAGEYRLYFK